MKWFLTDLLLVVAVIGALYRVRGVFAFGCACAAVSSVVLRFLWLAIAIVVVTPAAFAAGETYATWNPADKHSAVILTNGDLTINVIDASGAYRSARATVGKSSGKWFYEFTLNANQGSQVVGVATDGALLTDHLCTQTVAWTFYYTGQKINNAGCSLTTYGTSYTHGDVIGVAVDLDAGKIWTAKNGVWQASGNPSTGANPAFSNLSGLTIFPAWSGQGTSSGVSARATANFGQSAFAYGPPSGFKAGWFIEGPPEVVNLTPLFAMKSFSMAAFVLVGGVLASVFIQAIRTGRSG